MLDAADAVDQKPELNVKGEGGAGDEQITVKVKGQDFQEVQFKIKRKTKMSKVIKAFCEKQHVDEVKLRFLFDGKRIVGDRTAMELDMEDDDMYELPPNPNPPFLSPVVKTRAREMRMSIIS